MATLGRETKMVTVDYVARAMGYSRRSVRRWCLHGVIRGAKRGPGGKWRIPRTWVDAYSR